MRRWTNVSKHILVEDAHLEAGGNMEMRSSFCSEKEDDLTASLGIVQKPVSLHQLISLTGNGTKATIHKEKARRYQQR